MIKEAFPCSFVSDGLPITMTIMSSSAFPLFAGTLAGEKRREVERREEKGAKVWGKRGKDFDDDDEHVVKERTRKILNDYKVADVLSFLSPSFSCSSLFLFLLARVHLSSSSGLQQEARKGAGIRRRIRRQQESRRRRCAIMM